MIKLHYHYLLTKINVLIISIMFVLVIITNLFSINIFESGINKFIEKENIIINYKNGYILICKLCNVLFSCYLVGYSFYYNNDNYCVLISNYRKTRFPYFITKVFTLVMVIVIFNSLLYICYLFIGIIGNKNFVFQYDVFCFFIKSVLISLIYGFLSGLFIMLLKSYFVILISYILFIVSEVLVDNSSGVVEVYKILFPTAYNSVSFIVLILVLLIYFLLLLIKYNQHEI